MPVAAVAARRIGMMHLMILGAAFGVGAILCFALTGDAAGMLAGQILMGGVWGVFATASAVFLSSPAIASALGGLTGSLGVSVLGLPHVFLAPNCKAAVTAPQERRRTVFWRRRRWPQPQVSTALAPARPQAGAGLDFPHATLVAADDRTWTDSAEDPFRHDLCGS